MAGPIRMSPIIAPVGVVLDVAPFAMDTLAWSAVENMRVAGAGMERSEGERAILAPLGGVPKFAMMAPVLGTVWILYAGTAGVWVSNGVSTYVVTPATGWVDFAAGSMTGAIINGVACFSHPAAPPWYWDGTTVAAAVKPLPGFLAATKTLCLAAFNQHLFAGSTVGTVTNWENLAWSDAAAVGTVPASWTPTATNQAGNLALGTGGGPVQAMRGLGPSLMVYRSSGCWAVSYVGRPYIYTARKVAAEVGAASRNSVADFAGSHVILTPGDLVITDGSSMRSIGEARVKSWAFSQLSQEGLAVSHVYAVPSRSEVVFALALGRDDAANTALVWNTQRDAWSVRDLPLVTHSFSASIPSGSDILTWGSDSGTWESDSRQWGYSGEAGFQARAVGVSPGLSSLFLLDDGDAAADGSLIHGALEKTTMEIGAPGAVKLFSRLYPMLSGTPGTQVTVHVGAQMAAADPVLWGAPQVYTVGQSRWVDCRSIGRYMSIRFSGAPAGKWACAGFRVEYQEKGRR